jgi:uncharacterized membrane protein
MTTFAGWVYDDEQAAQRIERLLGRLAVTEGLDLSDGRVLVWPARADRPTARRIYSVPMTDALDDLTWGLLLGHVLYGAGAAMPEPLAAVGLNEDLVGQLRRGLRPGRSGLVVLGEELRVDQLARTLAETGFEAVATVIIG